MIPDDALEHVRQWAERKIPEDVRDQVRTELDVTDRTLTILECRPLGAQTSATKDAAVRCAAASHKGTRDQWSLYWRDPNLQFHEYDLAAPSGNVKNLLDEIDHDPTAIFWG